MSTSIKRISGKEVEHIAYLARIEITEKEKKLFTEQFNNILDFFEVINDLDTKGVHPTFHVVSLVNSFREDIVKTCLSQDDVLKNAPNREDSFFKAPKLL